MIYRQNGKKWNLPEVLLFEYSKNIKNIYPSNSQNTTGFYSRPPKPFFYTVEYRQPKANEYYISGAIPETYLALNDLSTKYLVATPYHLAKQKTIWIKDTEITPKDLEILAQSLNLL